MGEADTARGKVPDLAGIECPSAADLVRLITREVAQMGGVVALGPQRENLCRRAADRERELYPGFEWVIEAQGLPNLIHEFVHALYLGRLADDHGFDYGQIPLQMDQRQHRKWLWEELACCALSVTTCAPLEADPERFALDWFTEQFEIQGVFHGLEDDLAAFRTHICAQMDQPERVAELVETVATGHRLLSERLRSPDSPAWAVPGCDVLGLWSTYVDHSRENTDVKLAPG